MMRTHDNTPANGPKARIGRFVQDEDGVALVEFAIVLPMMLLVFAVIIEGSRLMLGFQNAIGGVRDATRYMSRIVALDICSTGGSVAGYAAQLQTIVSQRITGQSVFPAGITVNSVTPSYSCVVGTYRVSPAPVVQVSAQITVTYPFAGIFALVGSTLPNVTTTVTDRSRIFGS
jgi:Flp pilus assembly protein TadG